MQKEYEVLLTATQVSRSTHTIAASYPSAVERNNTNPLTWINADYNWLR